MKKTIIPILLFSSLICCLIAGDALTRFPVFDFTGGLNTKYADNLIEPNQCIISENILFDEKLGIATRDKYDYVCSLPVSSTTEILGSHVYTKDDGSTNYLIQAGSTVYSTKLIQKDAVFTVVKTGLSTKYPIRYATHYNNCWMTNGVDSVFNFDGSVTSDYTFIEKGRYIISAKGRLWIAGSFNNPSSVFCSEVDIDPTTETEWSPLNELKFGVGDGEIINGIKEIGNNIFVFKEKSAYALIGNAETSRYDFAIRRIFTNYGTVSNESIGDYENGIMFLDSKGLYFWNGTSLKNISEIIKPEIDKIGILSAGQGQWTSTTDIDFSTGTLENCYNNYGTMEVSSQSKTWSVDTDGVNTFAPEYTGSSQVMLTPYSIKISTFRESGRIKITLQPYSLSGEKEWYPGDLNTHSLSNMVTDSIFYPTSLLLKSDAPIRTRNPTPTEIEFRFNDLYNPTEYQIESIELTMRITAWFYGIWSGGSYNQDIPLAYNPKYSLRLYDGTRLLGRSIRGSVFPFRCQINTFNKNYEYNREYNLTENIRNVYNPQQNLGQPYNYNYYTYKINIANDYPETYNAISYGTPSCIKITLRSGVSAVTTDAKYWRQKKLDGKVGTTASIWEVNQEEHPDVYSAIHLKDFSVYTTTFTTPETEYFNDGVYISPIFDTGYVSPSYKHLYSDPDCGTPPRNGTVVLYTRAGENPTPDATWSDWQGVNMSSETNATTDNRRYFQWQAAILTSSATFSPEIFSAELEYCVTPATYTSKAFYVGQNISEWGSFVATDENTVTYKIGYSSYQAAEPSTDAGITWATIENNSDITISTGASWIYWQGFLSNKNSKIQSVTISWFTSKASGGGVQNVAAINFDNRYYLATSTYSNYNDLIFVYDKNHAFTSFTNIPVSSFFKDSGSLYVCSSTQPIILKMFVENGSEESFLSKWKSGHIDLSNPDIEKTLRYVYLTSEVMSDSFVDFEYSIDSSTNYQNVYLDLSENRNNRIPIKDGTVAKNFFFVVSSTAAFNIQGWNAYYSTNIGLR